MDKSKLKIDQSQSKPNQEIGSWESEGQNILSSLGEYQNKQRNDNNSHISKATVDSKTQLSARFLSSYRRQNPSQGGNLQTVYSSLTNNSNVLRLNSISPQQATDEKNIINISSISKNDTLEEQILVNTQQSNQINQQEAIDSNDQQGKQIEQHSSWIFMSPNYIEHRKQLQVGMLIDRHNLKNRKIQQGQKTIESATFNDKDIILEINQDVVQQNYADINQKQETNDKSKQKFKAIQCKQITMPQDLNKDVNKSTKLKSEQNGQDLFKQLNYYDVQEIKGQDSLDTLNIKNELKKYKNLRPGTYIGVVPKKESSSSQDNNFYVLKNHQLSNTLDLSKLKLLQSTNTSFQSSRIRRKKQNYSYSGDQSLTDRYKEQDFQNINQITQECSDKEQEKLQLNIVKYPNQKNSCEKIYSQTSRNSFSLNDHNDFSEKFREQVQQNTQADSYSPLKPKFTLNCNQQRPQQKKMTIKGGGGFYYLKDDMLFKIDKEDELIQHLNSLGEYNLQLHPIQKFIEHEKKKENIQIQKMQQKEQEVYIIKQELQQRELNYSPTSLVNKYTNQMRDNPKLKKNLFYVNKKLNKLERKRTIEEFRTRSNSPLAQIIDAVNQNPLVKQSTTFYCQKNSLPAVRNSQSPQVLKYSKQKVISELIQEQQNPNHSQNQSQPLGQTQYKKYRKWKGSPLFNLENNDLNRNPYINCGFSPLIAQQSPVQFNNKTRSQSSKKKSTSQQQQQCSQIQQLYNPIPQILFEQAKKYKPPLQN
ncbi:hypothetical protein ABPG73_008670 [Tetrahymena malaccensis]